MAKQLRQLTEADILELNKLAVERTSALEAFKKHAKIHSALYSGIDISMHKSKEEKESDRLLSDLASKLDNLVRAMNRITYIKK